MRITKFIRNTFVIIFSSNPTPSGRSRLEPVAILGASSEHIGKRSFLLVTLTGIVAFCAIVCTRAVSPAVLTILLFLLFVLFLFISIRSGTLT